MKTFHLSPALLFALLIVSFSEDYSCRRSGLKGHVYLVTGNQMPSPDEIPAPPKGIETTLYIYALTNISEVSREGSSAFYKTITTELVKKVRTDEKGYFKSKLKPGIYSLFVKKDGLFYSSQFDEKNNIHPVEIKSGQMTDVIFKVNYSAVY